jgi:transcriptional regulator with XRE-family HTH domain
VVVALLGYDGLDKTSAGGHKTMSTFAERLKRLREAAGLSQPELAERAGMNRFGVAKLEQGVREPSWATVQALAAALGVTVLDFADDTPPTKRPAAQSAEEKPRRPRKASAERTAPKKEPRKKGK